MTTPDNKNNERDAVSKIRVVEDVLRRWDPIGVQPGRFAPADEYDSFAPHIVFIVEGGCSTEVLVAEIIRTLQPKT